MPQSALEAAADGIAQLNFPREGMLSNYDYSFGTYTFNVNSMVFADKFHRNPAEYASFTIFNPANGQSDVEIIKYLSYTSAPFHLIHRQDRFALWGTQFIGDKPEPIPVQDDISYDNLSHALAYYREDFNPKRIIDVKQGRDQFVHPIFKNFNTLQLSLFALEVTADLLEDHFKVAVNRLRQDKINETLIVDLATQLLGLSILRDTRALGVEEYLRGFYENTPLDQIVKAAIQRFPKYFDLSLFERHYEAAENAYEVLSRISYAAFAPDMLSRLYTTAYNEEKRRELGRYDTPLYLTRHIWDNIPVEYLSPDNRITADMTCGWGSFLVAGHDRLSNLSDMEPYLLSSVLFGNDSDAFTSKLASLALLLYSGADSWEIGDSDALSWRWLKNHRPNIIVGNPPFMGNRKNPEKTVGKARRQQKADTFLNYAIDRLAPDGYLAMLMPLSFLASQASPDLRKQLLKNSDVQEIWELPAKVFQDVTAETLVLFAQKKAAKTYSSYPVRTRFLQRNTLRAFQKQGTFTHSLLAPNQGVWNETSRVSEHSVNTHIIRYSSTLTENVWNNLNKTCISLESIAHIFQGMNRGNNPKVKRNLDSVPKSINWLTKAQSVLPKSFMIKYDKAKQGLYPNEFVEPRLENEEYLSGEKVLLTSVSNPSWGKRVKVAIEHLGFYVSDNFYVIVPNEEGKKLGITLEVIAAIIDWKVSNAWIIDHLKSPKIPKFAIRTIPFPRELSKDTCKQLTNAVKSLEAAINNLRDESKFRYEIDTVLQKAYNLDDEIYELFDLIENWNQSNIISLDNNQGETSNPNWAISGITEEILVNTNQVKLWLEGFANSQLVEIVAAMPGWMLRPNAAFRTKIPRSCIKNGSLENVTWGKFLPQTYTYLDEDELFDELAKLNG